MSAAAALSLRLFGAVAVMRGAQPIAMPVRKTLALFDQPRVARRVCGQYRKQANPG